MRTRQISRTEGALGKYKSLEEVKNDFPERQRQADAIWRILGTRSPLVVYGPSGTGKSAVVGAVSKARGLRWVTCDCSTADSDSAIFKRILVELSAGYSSRRVVTTAQFVEELKRSRQGLVIVLDHADRLRGPQFSRKSLALLMRISEFAGRDDVHCVLLTHVRWEQFVDGDPTLPRCFIVRFHPYTSEETVDILVRTNHWDDRPKFRELCALLVDVLFEACRDLRELQLISETHFPGYIEQHPDGVTKEDQAGEVWARLRRDLTKAVHALYRRYKSTTLEQDQRHETKHALSYHEKVLLVALYLASHNPESTDQRYFTPNSRERKRRRHSMAGGGAADESEQQSSRIVPLARILAIFSAIQPHCETENANYRDKGSLIGTNIFVHLSSLAEMRYITRHDNNLNEPRFRTLIDKSTAQAISGSLGFEMQEFLHVADRQR